MQTWDMKDMIKWGVFANLNNKTEYTEEEKAFIKQCKENKKLKNERKVKKKEKEKEKEKTCERTRLWYQN